MQTTQSQLSRRKLLSTTVFGLPAMGALGALGLSGATPASAAQTTGADFLRTAETKTGCSYLWGGTGPDRSMRTPSDAGLRRMDTTGSFPMNRVPSASFRWGRPRRRAEATTRASGTVGSDVTAPA